MSVLLEPYHKVKESSQIASTFSLKRKTAAGYVKKVFNYIYVPAFSIVNTWYGASQIIGKYNYTLEDNFTLLELPTRPNDTFVLCITFGSSRYKLWEDIGELLYFDLFPLGTLISSSFSIEVWNVDGESPALNPGPLILNISSLTIPTLPPVNCDEQVGVDKSSLIETCDNTFTLTGFNPSTEQYSFVNNPCVGEQIPL
jgi:hypothetical protein